MFDDWMDRYAMLIEMGKECPIIDDKYRDEAHLINGCQSRVWLNAELKDGKVYYSADSDAVITKGIVNLLIKVFSGQTPEDIRFIVFRRNRFEGTLVAHTFQWPLGYVETDAALCRGV